MLSTSSLILAFAISIISVLFLKLYDNFNIENNELAVAKKSNLEYFKLFLIVLLSSIFTLFIRKSTKHLFSSFNKSNLTQKGGNIMNNPVNNSFLNPSVLNNPLFSNNLNPNNLPFNTNKPIF